MRGESRGLRGRALLLRGGRVAARFDERVGVGVQSKRHIRVPAKRRDDWALPDPKHMAADDYRAVRDEIERRVIALIAST